MTAYPQFKRCFDHQLENITASMDPDTWALLVCEGMVSRESQTWRTTGQFTEQGGVYPGVYRLDEYLTPSETPQGP